MDVWSNTLIHQISLKKITERPTRLLSPKKAYSVKPDPSLIPGIHGRRKEKTPKSCLLLTTSAPCVYTHTHTHAQGDKQLSTQRTQIKQVNEIKKSI